MLERLARWSYRRRRWMVVIWVVALVAISTLGAKVGGAYSANFSLPGTESQRAFDLLRERFPSQSGDTATIVFRAPAGVTDPAVQRTMQGLFAQVSKLPHVVSVTSPYTPPGARAVSRDGTIAFAPIQFSVRSSDVAKSEAEHMISLGAQASGPNLQVEFGGPVIENAEFEPPGKAEAVGLLAAVLILLITFGSVLAMCLPILIALFGIGIGLGLVLLSANWISVPNFTPSSPR